MKRIQLLFVAPLLFACGPRTGIHNESTNRPDTTKQTFVCGNAIRDSQNYQWAQHTLGIDGDAYRGSELFKQNCAVCHDLMSRKFVGPGLKGFYSRIPEPKVEWLKNYILNSKKVYDSGDKYAKQLRQQYPEYLMTAFEDQLTDKDLNDIIVYVVGNTRE